MPAQPPRTTPRRPCEDVPSHPLPFRLLPLVRHLEDLDECLVDRASHRTLNPQNDASRVKGSLGEGCYLGPGRPARAGEAVTTPPSRPRSAPSARSLQPALWRSPPSAPPHCG